jgi:hypothetical protein
MPRVRRSYNTEFKQEAALTGHYRQPIGQRKPVAAVRAKQQAGQLVAAPTTWKSFLNNHVRDLVSIDFFVVPTVRNKVLFVLVVLAHHRRQVVVLNDRHLTRILTSYFNFYHRWRTHLALDMDSPQSRSVQSPARGNVVQFREVGSLHHHYERLAA